MSCLAASNSVCSSVSLATLSASRTSARFNSKSTAYVVCCMIELNRLDLRVAFYRYVCAGCEGCVYSNNFFDRSKTIYNRKRLYANKTVQYLHGKHSDFVIRHQRMHFHEVTERQEDSKRGKRK